MGVPYRYIVRPSLQILDSEKAHKLTVNGLSKFAETEVARNYSAQFTNSQSSNCIWKLRHPLGLAAG